MEPSYEELIVASLTGEATDEERRLLAQWRAASSENEAAYLRCRRMWELAGELGSSDLEVVRPAGAEVVEGWEVPVSAAGAGITEPAGGSPTNGPATGKRRLLTPPGWKAAALAASLVLGLGLGWFSAGLNRPGYIGPEQLITGMNEVATVTLRDGTVVRVAPESRLQFSPDGGARAVFLDGRAYFSVSRHDGEEFRVRTPSGDVEVLGTRFDVVSRNEEIQIAVVEGQVRVSAHGHRVDVAPNQVARTRELGDPELENVEDVFRVIDWLGAFLAFQSTPMDEVAAEFQRRFGVRIEIESEALRERTITGWFADQTPEQMIAGVCRAVAASCTMEGGVVHMQ